MRDTDISQATRRHRLIEQATAVQLVNEEAWVEDILGHHFGNCLHDFVGRAGATCGLILKDISDLLSDNSRSRANVCQAGILAHQLDPFVEQVKGHVVRFPEAGQVLLDHGCDLVF